MISSMITKFYGRKLAVAAVAWSGCLAGALFASGANAREIIAPGEHPSFAEVTGIVAGGSGCRGRVKAKLIGKELLRLDLGPIKGEAGAGVPRSAFREFCQISLDIEHSRGWTYGIEFVHTELKGYLTSGGRAEASLSYYFQGGADTSATAVELTGPDFVDDVVASEVDDVLFAPCNAKRALNVKQAVVARPSRSRGSLATLAITGPTHLLLKWKRCH